MTEPQPWEDLARMARERNQQLFRDIQELALPLQPPPIQAQIAKLKEDGNDDWTVVQIHPVAQNAAKMEALQQFVVELFAGILNEDEREMTGILPAHMGRALYYRLDYLTALHERNALKGMLNELQQLAAAQESNAVRSKLLQGVTGVNPSDLLRHSR